MQLRWSRRKPLTIKSYKRVEEMIVTLQLPPGSAISEFTLRKRLGMSLTPRKRRCSGWRGKSS